MGVDEARHHVVVSSCVEFHVDTLCLNANLAIRAGCPSHWVAGPKHINSAAIEIDGIVRVPEINLAVVDNYGLRSGSIADRIQVASDQRFNNDLWIVRSIFPGSALSIGEVRTVDIG